MVLPKYIMTVFIVMAISVDTSPELNEVFAGY